MRSNDPAQPPGPPAETTTLESRKGGPGRLQRVVRRGLPLRSTTAELIRVKRHKFPDAHRRPAGHGSPDRPELTRCPGYEDGSVIGHATSLPFAERFAAEPPRSFSGRLQRRVGPPGYCTRNNSIRSSLHAPRSQSRGGDGNPVRQYERRSAKSTSACGESLMKRAAFIPSRIQTISTNDSRSLPTIDETLYMCTASRTRLPSARACA